MVVKYADSPEEKQRKVVSGGRTYKVISCEGLPVFSVGQSLWYDGKKNLRNLLFLLYLYMGEFEGLCVLLRFTC